MSFDSPVAPSLSNYFFSPAPKAKDSPLSEEQPMNLKESSVSQETPTSSHRTESLSLVVSKKLCEDIKILTKLTNPKNSVNDTIVQILTDFTNSPTNQLKIAMFHQLLDELNQL